MHVLRHHNTRSDHISSQLTTDISVLKSNVFPLREAVENDEEDVFEDCIDSKSQIFSLSTTSESLYSKIYTTKKKFDDLLKSLLLLHMFVGRKLHSLKDVAMSNITQLATGHLTPVVTNAPHYNAPKPYPVVSEKPRDLAKTGHVMGKQLRRQNHMSIKNNAVNSNRKRGMKYGRFQSNVGHRESWQSH